MNRGYLSLWLLLFVAFGIIAAGSCFDNIEIGGYRLKTGSVMSELMAADTGMRERTIHDVTNAAECISLFDSEISFPVDSARAFSIDRMIPFPFDTTRVVVPADTIPVSKFPVEVDTTAKTILFFGDSMLEGLSPRLAAYCEASGHKLYTVIWYSSTTQVWGECDTLSTFIRRYKPDYIMACLGANELFVKDIATKRRAPLRHLLGEIGDRPLLWIGPPNWKDDTGINDLLSTTLEEGQFFLSNGMAFSRKSDGAHPTASSAARWMDSVVRWMPDHSLHPIRLNTPDKEKGRPAKVILLQPLQ